ncbi:MAG: PAS domain-containing protein [Alphaproteobacteria bacterium]|nr:PAS domain-containing protein [Alphaproteobacteria bacterium]
MLLEQDFQGFIDYWRRLDQSVGGVPSKSAIQLKDFPKAAPYFYLLERREHFDVPVRLLGTIIDSFLPTVNQGNNFLEVYEEDQRQFYADVIGDVCDYRCCADILRVITLANGSQIEIRSIGLPFTNEEGELCFVGGIVQTPDQDQLLGLSEQLQRVTSEPRLISYIDVGYGLPPSVRRI